MALRHEESTLRVARNPLCPVPGSWNSSRRKLQKKEKKAKQQKVINADVHWCRFRAHATERPGWNSAPASSISAGPAIRGIGTVPANLRTTTFFSDGEQFPVPGTWDRYCCRYVSSVLASRCRHPQLTHPISQDDDVEMPPAPLTHDIATPRRRIGGRCRKWAVSTQHPSDNSILMNEISEKTWNEELNKLFLVKIQLRGNYI